MSRKMIVLMIVILISIVGCGKVQMSPEYRQVLEMSAINVTELNERCQDGDMEACKQGLEKASKTLDLLVDALHGRDE